MVGLRCRDVDRRRVGDALTAVGLVALILIALIWGRTEAEQVEVFRELERRDARIAATATLAVVQTAVAAAVSTRDASGLERSPAAAPVRNQSVTPTGEVVQAHPTASPRPAPSATSTSRPSREILRIRAPSIGLEAPVVLSPIENGEWVVPRFVAGHLQGTALPGNGGNVVLSGHVQSLTSGNVFARLEDLQNGARVSLSTDLGEVDYVVAGRNVVPRDDLSVTRAGAREELTLITCTGVFNPLTSDYSHRLVVWAFRA
ncbi:MAG: class F sortase [Chloroflexi bacterium]|nr:class F sortase [Chloroflexota bacterium]